MTSDHPVFVVRTATPTDLPGILEVFVRAIKNTCTHDYSLEQISAWVSSADRKEWWKTKIQSQFFLVAESHQQIVGFASLEAGRYLDVLYVHPTHLRKGIAKKLYQTIEQEARKYNSQMLLVDASITARPFFEAMGFIVIRQNQPVINGAGLTNFRMEKTLVPR